MIQVLSKNVADKIAAGEVVERPLSIVKELVENAIDAGAKSIVVEIKNGGKTYIRITDDGSGIPEDQALLAFKRHATSKIRTDEDLVHIETLGFRGEALASIAAVSRIEMVTKTKEEKTGTRIRIEGSEVLEHIPAGCSDGTTFVVTDLFYNTPARYKFLKTDAAESTLIIDLISKLALAYTNIRMRLINNGNILFSTQGKGNLLNGILTVNSFEMGDHLVPVSAEDGFFKLEGYVSSPGYSKSSRKMQVFFVNGRIVSSRIMEKGISDAYVDKLFEGRYPVCFLFLKTAPDKLDVNIHPNKKEVRFDDERAVCQFVTNSVRNALMVKDTISNIKIASPQGEALQSDTNRRGIELSNTVGHANDSINMDSYGTGSSNTDCHENKSIVATNAANIAKDEFCKGINEQVDIKKLLHTIRQEENVIQKKAEDVQEQRSLSVQEKQEPYLPKPFDMTTLTQIGSVFATYILASDEDAMYLVDQHAAHERIFFEQLMRQYKSSEKLLQTILTPFVVNVSHAVQNEMSDMLQVLLDMGFDIEEFGPKAFLVKGVPMFMELGEVDAFLEYFLDHADDPDSLCNPAKIEKIISASCKSAVKANDVLNPEEIRQLILDLSKCENPYSCPHGRPTFLKLTKGEIEKMFKRA